MFYNRVATVSIAAWDDNIVVYHHESGDTHLLDSSLLPFVQVVCISNDVISFDDLLNCRPGTHLSLQKNQELIGDFLQQFVHLNILTPINCECQ